MGPRGQPAAHAIAGPAYRRVPNINLLRTRRAQKQITSAGRYSLLLAVFCLLGLMFLAYRQGSAADETSLLRAQLLTLRSQVAAAGAQEAEVSKVQSEIARLESGARDYQKLASFNSWSSFVLDVQQRSSSAGVTLTSVKQKAGGAVVSGWSPSPTEALAFHGAMVAADGVAQCGLSSLSKSPGEPRFSFTLDMTLKGRGQQ
ncbi:MAG: hypothetical protein HYX90_08515 [Chloroflexi bacterium]|nr:hypothetical protein [Chloroflexota bacterium]